MQDYRGRYSGCRVSYMAGRVCFFYIIMLIFAAMAYFFAPVIYESLKGITETTQHSQRPFLSPEQKREIIERGEGVVK